jgi:hypothetical protein
MPLPVFDTAGAGRTFGGTTFTWSHTAAQGAYVLCAINAYAASVSTVPTSVTYGSSAMTQKYSHVFNGTITSVYLYELLFNPLTGAQTVTVTFPTPASTFGEGNSISYTGVGSDPAIPATASGTGTALSQTVGCGSDQRVVQVFTTHNPLSAAATGGTNRYFVGSDPGFSGAGMSINDAVGPTTFTATQSAAGPGWYGSAIVLRGAPNRIIGQAVGRASLY